jgi:FAD/FMN-containing dehydrogenase
MGKMPSQWSNWSGSLRFTPAQIAVPADESALTALVTRAAEAGGTIRPVGSRHSSTELIATDDILVAFDRFQGIVATDQHRAQAIVKPGTKLEQLGRDLAGSGLDFPNLGDVATQTVAGVIATGTHGSGRDLPNLACLLIGGRLVTGTGEIVEFGKNDIEVLRAARVGLGALGIMTQLRLQLVPAYTIQRREYCTTMDAFWPHLDQLIAENRGFDFYWYPRSDEVKARLLNPPGGGTAILPYAQLVTDERGPAHQLIPRHSHLPYPFDEMEYAIPTEAGPSCFQEVRERIRARHRRTVAWRVLYRTVAADDAYLSPSSGRPTVTISLHQNASLPFWEYFLDLEPIFRACQGRPHWAKKHTLRAEELRPLYPGWDRFLAVRQRLDPRGVFLSPYLRELLGVEQ